MAMQMSGLEELVVLLQKATLTDSMVRVEAEARLGQLERRSGFVLALLDVCSNFVVAEPLRLVAAISAKHAVTRSLEATGQEREKVKAKLLEMLAKPLSPAVLVQLALIVGLLARADWPHWERLFPWMIEAVSSKDLSLRGLTVLRAVLDSLSTLRLPEARRQFASSSLQLVQFLLPGLTLLCSRLAQNGGVAEARHALSLLKCLCLLILQAFPLMSGTQDGTQHPVLALLEAFTTLSPLAARSDPLGAVAQSMMVRIGRCALGLLRTHPSFQPLSSAFAQALMSSLGAQNKLAVVALLFLHELVSRELGGQMPWLSAEFVGRLQELLILRHFLLSPSDLQQWREEPEAFVLEENHSRDDDSVRTAGLQLFWSMLKYHGSLTSPPLNALLKEYMNPVPPDEGLEVGSRGYMYLVRKEAVYTAVGLASEQEVAVDFKQWYPALCEELRCPVPFIRRRVLVLLREWMSSSPSEARLSLLASLSGLIRSDPDLVVRLAAVQGVRSLVTMHLESTHKPQALGLIPQLLQALFTLLRDVQETESKTGVVYVLRIVVKCFEVSAAALLPVFTFEFPATWESCRQHSPAQVDLLTLVGTLITALGDNSASMHSFLQPLITHCLEPGAKDRGHLERPGLVLWLGEVKAAPVFAPTLGSLFASLWGYWAEHSQLETDVVLDLAEAYLVCGKGDFVRQLDTVCRGLLRLWQSNVLAQTPREVMVLQRVCGVCHLLVRLLPQDFFASSLFEPLATGMCQILSAHFLRFPDNTLMVKERCQEFAMAQSLLYVFVPFLGRLTFLKIEALMQLFQRSGVLLPLWDQWIKTAHETTRKVSLLDRKLCVLAATRCLSIPSCPFPLCSALPALVQCVVAVSAPEDPGGLQRDLNPYNARVKLIDQEDAIFRLANNLREFVHGAISQTPHLARETNPNLLRSLNAMT